MILGVYELRKRSIVGVMDEGLTVRLSFGVELSAPLKERLGVRYTSTTRSNTGQVVAHEYFFDGSFEDFESWIATQGYSIREDDDETTSTLSKTKITITWFLVGAALFGIVYVFSLS